MVVTVYITSRSPPARAVLMTTEIIGLKIKTIDVNLETSAQKSPEYLKKNPTHTVPLLEDEDFIISDSHVIMTYLVSKYGAELKDTLYPADLKTRAIIDQRLYVDATILFQRLLAAIKYIYQSKDRTPELTTQQIEEFHEAYGFVEKYLEMTTFLAGSHITLADISAVSTISGMNIVVPIDENKYPKITQWWGKIKPLEWYQKVNVRGLIELEEFLKMKRN